MQVSTPPYHATGEEAFARTARVRRLVHVRAGGDMRVRRRPCDLATRAAGEQQPDLWGAQGCGGFGRSRAGLHVCARHTRVAYETATSGACVLVYIWVDMGKPPRS